jgi:hypothetical protein
MVIVNTYVVSELKVTFESGFTPTVCRGNRLVVIALSDQRNLPLSG